MYLQYKLGPRFFIPKFLLPNYFNYNTKLHRTEENKEIDCSICLLNIFSPDPTALVEENNRNDALLTN